MPVDALDSDKHEGVVSSCLTKGELEARLNDVGLRITAPRLEVLGFFCELDKRHATADEIHRLMMDQGSPMALGTLYRVLSNLTEVGILSRWFFDSGIAVFELRSEHHHDHAICLACGRIDEFVDSVIHERRRAVAQAVGFAVAQHQLALYGYCRACRQVDGGR